jgi:hypothetical protein
MIKVHLFASIALPHHRGRKQFRKGYLNIKRNKTTIGNNMPLNQIVQNCSAHNPGNINSTYNYQGLEIETSVTNKIEVHEKIGKEIWQLSQALNTTDNITSVMNYKSKIPWKKSIITYFPQLIAHQFGGHVLSARSITSSIPPAASLGNDIVPQSLPFSSYSDRIISKISQFITRFEDPLRFPAADGSYIPTAYSTIQQNHNINTRLETLRMFNINIEDKDYASLDNMEIDISTEIKNVAFVIDNVLVAQKTNQYESVILKTITDILVDNDRYLRMERLSGKRKLAIIDDWIERQVFDDKLYKYLRTQILKNHDKGLELVPTLKFTIHEKLHQTFSKFPEQKSAALCDYVQRNIVDIEFPALSHTFHVSHIDPFQWGLCHVGYQFLNKLMIDVAKIDQLGVYTLGYDLYHQFREGWGYPEWLRLFSLPAMVYFTQSASQKNIGKLARNPLLFQEKALNAYFNYWHDEISGKNPITKFQTSVRHFIEHFSTPNKIIDSEERNLNYDKLLHNVSQSYKDADQVYIQAAFQALKNEDYRFIKKGKTYAGSFALSVPAKDISAASNTNTDIQYILATLCKNPLYLKIFKCELNGQQRIYALRSLSTGYVVKRVDSDVSLYRELLSAEDKLKYSHNTVLSKSFKDVEISHHRRHGLENISEYVATENTRAFDERISEIDGQEDGLREVMEKLHSLHQVPFRQCFDNAGDDAVNPNSLKCSFNYSTHNLIPFFRHSAVNDANDYVDAYLSSTTFKHDLTSGFAMGLAAQQAFSQAPNETKTIRRHLEDESLNGRKSGIADFISEGIASLGENGSHDYFFSLSGARVFSTLRLANYTNHVLDRRGKYLNLIHTLTNNNYRKLSYMDVILSEEDHSRRSQDAIG